MSAAKHTPGPWVVKEKQDRTMMIASAEGTFVAKVVGSTAIGDVRARFAADARLIAAAPDLLAALQTLSNVALGMLFTHYPQCAINIPDSGETRCSCDVGLIQKEAHRARAAIAKATE